MTSERTQRRWPVLQLLVAGTLITAFAVYSISRLHVEADIYGLLGHDDPEVAKFSSLASVTAGLEELLVVLYRGLDELVPELFGLLLERVRDVAYAPAGA